MNVFLCCAALVLAVSSLSSVHATVRLTEIAAAPDERAIRWDPVTGQGRIGIGPAWYDPTFNAASWATGAAPLGMGFPNPGTNLQPLLFSRVPSLYVRKEFAVSAADAVRMDSLRLRIDYNDGFIAYINGKEAVRARMGAAKMVNYADETAVTSRPGTGFGPAEFIIARASDFLVPGTNVIAIQVHNFSVDAKGDLKIDAALELLGGTTAAVPFTENFNNGNNAERLHTNVAGSVNNTTAGTPPVGWLAAAPVPMSDTAWQSLSIKQTAASAGGVANSGHLAMNFTGTGPVQPARILGPEINLVTQWRGAAVTAQDLDAAVLSFKYKAPSGFDAAVRMETGTGSAALELGMVPTQGSAAAAAPSVTGWWRFENHLAGASEVPATAGAAIENAPSLMNNAQLQAAAVTAGAAKYSADRPGPFILDPLSGSVIQNAHSMDATAANARFRIGSDALLNTEDFTLEFWMKLTGEPTQQESFVKRQTNGPLADSDSTGTDFSGWDIFMDHSSGANYGKISARWDAPGAKLPPPLTASPFDFNKVILGDFIFVDTPSGSGNPIDYTAGTPDFFTLGDQVNDMSRNQWQHVAIAYTGANKLARIYTNYALSASTTTFKGTFVHPAAGIDFGKFSSGTWALLIDEVRYTGRALVPAQMLRVVAPDADGYSTWSSRLSSAPAASRDAFLAAINSDGSRVIRPAFTLTANSYVASPGKDLQIDDVTLTIDRNSNVGSFLGMGTTWQYQPGYGEPSGGVLETKLPPEPNNPFDTVSLPPFPDVPGFSDWVELHNDGTAPVDLSTWTFTDDGTPDKWRFPAGTVLGADQRLIVLCDDKSTFPNLDFLHTNFKLSEGGERLRLYEGAALRDDVSYPRQDKHQVYGRQADGTWVFLDTATPALPNAGVASAVRCRTPDMWKDAAATMPATGGFFTSTQTIYLTTPTPGAQIRFTLDATEPTATSTLYTGPVAVTAGSSNKTGRILRAQAFLAGAVPSGIKSATFLINQASALTAQPAMCFTANTTRDLYETYGVMAIQGGLTSANTGDEWNSQTTNDYNLALKHGRAYERPVFVEWHPQDGTVGFAEHAGLRIASSPFSRPRLSLSEPPTMSPFTSSSAQKPSFNLFFREDYGKSSVEYPFLGQNYPVRDFDQLRPRAGKNDISDPFIRDELVRRMGRQMGLSTVQGTINTLYINAIYKGYYNTVERYRESFFQSHYDSINPWDIRINDGIEEGDGVEWANMLSVMQTMSADTGNQAKWEAARSKVELDEMIDYWLMNIYTAMWDWPGNNWVASRERTPNGVWRLHIWDAEGSFGLFGIKSASYNSIGTDLRTGTSGQPALFTRLYASPEFRIRFADRVNKWFFNGAVLDDRVIANNAFINEKNRMKTTFGALLNFTNGATFNDGIFTNWMGTGGRRATLLSTNSSTAASFRSNGLWPAVEPVTFSKHGGKLAAGEQLTVNTNATVPAASTVYYTTDGSDPRAFGGAVAAGAQVRSYVTTKATDSFAFAVPGTLETMVKVRVRSGTTWSALTEAEFQFNTVPAAAENLVVSSIMYNPPSRTPAEVTAGVVDKDDMEYIELRAIGSAAVDLTAVKLVAGVSFDFVNADIQAIAPGQSILLVQNKAAFRTRYGTALDNCIAGEYLGRLANGGERLWLRGQGDALIKDFTYLTQANGWPAAANGEGSALRLVNGGANPDHGLAASWVADGVWGGTPCGQFAKVTFGGWVNTFFNAAQRAVAATAGPAADPDGDGVPNALEFALGANPNDAKSGPSLSTPILQVTGGRVEATWLVGAGSAADAGLTAEISEDLRTWVPMTPAAAGAASGGLVALRFTDPAVWNQGKRFVRLKATVVP